MASYVANCKNCARHFDIDWDGDHRLLPVAGTCPHCAYADGYGQDQVLLVGAFQLECPSCGEAFNPEVPARYIDYGTPTGLSGPMQLTCKVCSTTSSFQPEDVVWLGRGESMPRARPLGIGQQRP